ncbi:MAG: hypothetical protein H0X39_20205, partial [Actinobacteria bacterium]|nr:hypothetical protein [Actinomycetota bacterium]
MAPETTNMPLLCTGAGINHVKTRGDPQMNGILVTYGTKHGSTIEVAETIATALRGA